MKRNLILLGIIAAFAAVILFFSKIESVEDYYTSHATEISPDDDVVTMSINCSTVLDHWDKLKPQLRDEKYIPADGMILPETQYVLRKGDTAFDILERACQYEQIQMDYLGADATIYSSVYVRGINYLYERYCGDLSGWMIRVNGNFPSVGADRVRLNPGDRIEWVYTCDLGRDVGDPYMSQKIQEDKIQKVKEAG